VSSPPRAPKAPAPTAKPAKTVAGHRLLRPLEGSPSTWEVHSDDPKRLLLLTLGAEPGARGGEDRRGFQRLLRARASLRHPHLAPVVDGGVSPRGPYVVVSLPQVRPLSTLIAQGPMNPERAYRLLVGVADALDAAHARWLVHADLTPRAIMVEPGPREWALMTDFGIVHERPPLGFDRAAYHPPEELGGLRSLPQSNVYSLASILYACLAGAPPFSGDSIEAVLASQLAGGPAPLTERRPELPKAVDRVFEAGLSKKPGERPTSPGELMHEVGAALGVLPKPKRTSESLPKRPRRLNTLHSGWPFRTGGHSPPELDSGVAAKHAAEAMQSQAPAEPAATRPAAPEQRAAKATKRRAPEKPAAKRATTEAQPAAKPTKHRARAKSATTEAQPAAKARKGDAAAKPSKRVPAAKPSKRVPAAKPSKRRAPAKDATGGALPLPTKGAAGSAPAKLPVPTQARPGGTRANEPGEPDLATASVGLRRPKKPSPSHPGRPARREPAAEDRRARAARRTASRRLVAVGLGMTVAFCGTVGWVSGRTGGDPTASLVDIKRAAAVRDERAARREWLLSTEAAIERLSAHRAAKRWRLRAARRPAAQARLSGVLAREFARAARAVDPPPAAVAEGPPLVAALRRTSRAYRRLEVAVRRGGRARYRRSVRRVRRAEADVRRGLAGLG
jgi:serine/threonine protein kinase